MNHGTNTIHVDTPKFSMQIQSQLIALPELELSKLQVTRRDRTLTKILYAEGRKNQTKGVRNRAELRNRGKAKPKALSRRWWWMWVRMGAF